MEPKRVDPLTGLIKLLESLASGNPFPDKAFTTKVGDITVDTAPPKDTKIWETGIKRPTEGKWVIVEQYPDEEEAKAGHQKWVEFMMENPNAPLKDIDLWSLNDFGEV